MLLRAVIIGRQLLYALDHAYFALIVVNRRLFRAYCSQQI